MNASNSRLIATAVMFVGSVIMAVTRPDTQIIGVVLGLATLVMFVIEYARSFRG